MGGLGLLWQVGGKNTAAMSTRGSGIQFWGLLGYNVTMYIDDVCQAGANTTEVGQKTLLCRTQAASCLGSVPVRVWVGAGHKSG